MGLPRWSLRNPVTTSMVLVSVLMVGAISAPKLPLAFLPEVSFPELEITIPYPNALPAQVEEEITRPAEEALATLSRVRRINSWSSARSEIRFRICLARRTRGSGKRYSPRSRDAGMTITRWRSTPQLDASRS